MPISHLLVKGIKLAVKGTGFVSLVAVVNTVPVAAYAHFGPWSQEEVECGMRDEQFRSRF